jgi:ketoreductase RED2
MGGIDVLVNNAGWTSSIDHRDLEGLTEDVFRKTFEVNVFGTWELTKLAMPHLERSPDAGVITVTSIAGLRPIGSSIAYAMSKAALNHMVRLMAKSHGPIRFNAVAPGLVATPWTEEWDEMHEEVSRRAPLGRSATADDCAEAVLGILRNRYMTGSIVVVDGGLTQVM